MDTANRQTLNIFFGFLESFVKKGEKQEEWSFTRWAEQQGMQGHALRKAKTIARALELATHDIGPAYLVSRPAEVQLRRLIALALSVNAGWRVAGHLEELPGDSIISALPASLVKKLYDAFSLELKIEEAAKGKKGEKKDYAGIARRSPFRTSRSRA